MKASTFVFAIDLLGEGTGHVLDAVRHRAGLDGVTLAATYHHAFDVLPHNPATRLHAHEGGATYFRPDLRRYEGLAIQPIVSRFVGEIDPLGTLVAEAERHGMTVQAWTNHLQATDQGARHPECVPRNAFGDPYERWLCVANPDVRAYVRTVSADIARYGVESLMLESLCYQPYDLVFLHGRSHFPYSPTVRFALSLCFCAHCTAAARRAGIGIEGLRRYVRTQLNRALAGEPCQLDDVPLEQEAVAALADGEMGALLNVRRSIVASLITETSAAVKRERPATRVVVLDWSGGLVSYASGEAEGRVTCDRSWQDGIDPAEIAAAADGIAMLGYTRDTDRLRTDIAGYRALVPAGRSLSAALRPMPPDCHSPVDLAARVAAARAAGVDWIEFYHYGLMRLQHLDWIGEVLGRERSAERVDAGDALRPVPGDPVGVAAGDSAGIDAGG